MIAKYRAIVCVLVLLCVPCAVVTQEQPDTKKQAVTLSAVVQPQVVTTPDNPLDPVAPPVPDRLLAMDPYFEQDLGVMLKVRVQLKDPKSLVVWDSYSTVTVPADKTGPGYQVEYCGGTFYFAAQYPGRYYIVAFVDGAKEPAKTRIDVRGALPPPLPDPVKPDPVKPDPVKPDPVKPDPKDPAMELAAKLLPVWKADTGKEKTAALRLVFEKTRDEMFRRVRQDDPASPATLLVPRAVYDFMALRVGSDVQPALKSTRDFLGPYLEGLPKTGKLDDPAREMFRQRFDIMARALAIVEKQAPQLR